MKRSERGSLRILVTGSRTWTDEKEIARALFEEWWHAGEPRDVTLVHGTARGADVLAAKIAVGQGWKVEPHPADWERYGNRAGYIRNSEMVNSGVDVCVAFILDGSKGATMCAALASNAKVPTRVVSMTSAPVESVSV